MSKVDICQYIFELELNVGCNYELRIFKLQLGQQRQGHVNRLEEIQVAADSIEAKALYRTYSIGIK